MIRRVYDSAIIVFGLLALILIALWAGLFIAGKFLLRMITEQ